MVCGGQEYSGVDFVDFVDFGHSDSDSDSDFDSDSDSGDVANVVADGEDDFAEVLADVDLCWYFLLVTRTCQ